LPLQKYIKKIVLFHVKHEPLYKGASYPHLS